MALSTIQEIQQIIAQSFTGGDTGMAGIIMYAVTMAFIFLLFGKNNLMVCFALMFPITFIFTTLSILPIPLTVLMALIAVVGLSKERSNANQS